jgi:hypothetical protein
VQADEMAIQAENKNSLVLLVKSNALRKNSRQKRKEVDAEVKKV